MVHLVVNLEQWNALPPAYRAALSRACDAVSMRMLAKYDSINPPSFRRLIAAGAVIRQFPQPVLEACHRATPSISARSPPRTLNSRGGMESITAFLREHLPWLQASDHAFDAFQIAINGRG